MKNVIIDQKGCRLDFERQLLLIYHDKFLRPISLPFSQIQSLTIATGVDIHSHLLTKLAEHHIAVIILPAGRIGSSCVMHGGWHAGVVRRQMQYELFRDEILANQWATVIVKLKIHEHYHTLDWIMAQSQHYPKLNKLVNDDKFLSDFEKSMTQLKTARKSLKTYFLRKNCTLVAPYRDTATLRGIEGSAAAIFFGQYQRFFDEKWQFLGRNRRPPKDPVNALLSLGYTLLQGVCEQAVFTIGFDPHLGVLHEVSYGRKSMACDLAELQRHQIEKWVWQLMADDVVTLKDFNFKGDDRPCELLKSGRQSFYASWSKLRIALQKQSLKILWCWLHRIEKDFDFTDEHEQVYKATLNADLAFIDDFE